MDTSALRAPLAKGVATYLLTAAEYPHATLKGVTALETIDILEIEIEPQLSQKRVVSVVEREPVKVAFLTGDHSPSVWSTRPDFPTGSVHTAFEPLLGHVTLCVWEENWADLKRQLTPQTLIERIRSWYSRLADGTLHQVGQQLEALIPAASHTIIVPAGECPPKLEVEQGYERNGQVFICLGAKRNETDNVPKLELLEFRVAQTQVHGAQSTGPTNIEELQSRLAEMQVDLLPSLSDWARSETMNGKAKAIPLIVVSIPKTDRQDGPILDWEYWAFTSRATLADLAYDLGQIDFEPNGKPYALIPRRAVDYRTVSLDGLRLIKRLTRSGARLLSGHDGDDLKLVAIGAGAIGSNVIVNSAHAGIGTWTIIDNDVLLPHNTVRQQQGNSAVGHPKAVVTAYEVASLFQDKGGRAIVADILDGGSKAEAIAAAMSTAAATVDFSASPAVLGNLADRAEPQRLVSMFFNPRGDQLVVLAEDARRETRLDEIEAQYYQAVAAMPQLADHLDDGRLGFLRYANACQDLSRPLPPWQVQTLAGVGAKQLLDLAKNPSESASVWQLDTKSGAIRALQLPVYGVHRVEEGGIRISLSKNAVFNMRKLRARSLPNETGGVLIGSFDTTRKIVHIVDVLPAPPDSEQRPTYFVRGKKDLLPAVEAIATRTVNNLQYLGEWHSHPNGASTSPSSDDRNVFDFLTAHLSPTGQPFGMMICGDEDIRILFGWHDMRLDRTCRFGEPEPA